MIFFADTLTEPEEIEEPEDTDSELDDAVLDEIGDGEDEATDDEAEGFGHIEEDEDGDDTEQEDEEAEDESLEDDAEDVDYDSFDDVDEM